MADPIESGASVALPSPEEIEAAKTENGGWNKEQLAAWGVSWPPPKGWRQVLIAQWERALVGGAPMKKWQLSQRAPEREEQVFFVWRDGGRNPVFRHPTYWHCRKEAERLALANPGVRFHIVSTHRIVEAPAAEVTND